jgi:hypothetical protein
MTPVDVRNDIQANLIPNAILIPAVVGEGSRAYSNTNTRSSLSRRFDPEGRGG